MPAQEGSGIGGTPSNLVGAQLGRLRPVSNRVIRPIPDVGFVPTTTCKLPKAQISLW